MSKKALILTWEKYQDHEVIYPYYRVQEDDFEVDIMTNILGRVHGYLGTYNESTKLVSDFDDQKKYDCTKYSTNVFETSDGVQGGHIMSAVAEKDFSANKVPALSFFDYDDDVLNSYETEKRLDRWGNKKSKIVIVDTGEKDVTQHFIVGFLNPELDDFYIKEINNWINNL